jgi:hypothetical protein
MLSLALLPLLLIISTDFYVRSYIKNESPSAISWVGSFNAFLVVAGGILSGKLYDRGYL